jgi:hypothetical protein
MNQEYSSSTMIITMRRLSGLVSEMEREKHILQRISDSYEIRWDIEIYDPVRVMDESVYLQRSEKYIHNVSSNDVWYIFRDRYTHILPGIQRVQQDKIS